MACHFYKKYRKVRDQVEFEQLDMRNLINVTKTDTELGEIRKKKQDDKFHTLTDDAAKI